MVRARWVNGRAVPEEPVDWPEGSVVFVSRTSASDGDRTELASQDNDLQSVTRWLAWYDSLAPLVFAPGEEEEIELTRRQIADDSRHSHDRRIEGLFE